jgi:alpha-tubulin suppressor-like RCC1 family protein
MQNNLTARSALPILLYRESIERQNVKTFWYGGFFFMKHKYIAQSVLKAIVLSFLAVVIVIGCIGPGGEDPGPGSGNGTLKLEFASGLTAKLITPNVPMTVASYDITGSGPAGATFSEEGFAGSNYTQSGLAAGTWTVTVTAKNTNGTSIGAATELVTITAGETTTKTMTIVPLTGPGTLTLSLSWPEGVLTSPSITAVLTNSSAQETPLSFTITGSSATCTVNVEAGYYDLTMALKDGETTAWGKYEAVRILSGQTSSATYTLADVNQQVNGTLELSVIEDLKNPLSVSLSGGEAELVAGSNMTLGVTVSPVVTPDSYSWYLNGQVISGQTGSTITIGSALALGHYSLDVRVSYNGTVSSGGVSFTVVETGIKSISCGREHTMILKNNGTLWATGFNNKGQLGDGTTIDKTTPVQVMTNVESVSTGQYYTMILKTDGTLWAVGYNSSGQLGDGTTIDKTSPVQVMTGVRSIYAGYSHTFIVKTDGTLWATGSNNYGQLGDGTIQLKSTPIQIMSGVFKVSVGMSHSMIIKTDGTLWATGYNIYGQLGDGTTVNKTTPVQVMNGVTSVSAGGQTYTMILKNDGSLWAVGGNGYGNLGDGTTIYRYIPVQVLDGVAMVSTGSDHTMILKNDGTLWAAGYNSYGQLGDGSNVNKSTLVQVMNDVKNVSTGESHTIILKNDNTLWGTGYNVSGQLGDGTNINKNAPVQMQIE